MSEFDENKAMGLFVKKWHNQKKSRTSKKNSAYRRVNDRGVYRNNAKAFEFDYEEDFYEPKN